MLNAGCRVREKEVRMVNGPWRNSAVAVAAFVSIVSASSHPVAGQGSTKSPAGAASAKAYVPPKTPWGDPDLQGNFTNKYEQGTPFERPEQFNGRRHEDLNAAELAAILEQRQRQVLDRPTGVGPDQ